MYYLGSTKFLLHSCYPISGNCIFVVAGIHKTVDLGRYKTSLMSIFFEQVYNIIMFLCLAYYQNVGNIIYDIKLFENYWNKVFVNIKISQFNVHRINIFRHYVTASDKNNKKVCCLNGKASIFVYFAKRNYRCYVVKRIQTD